MTFNVGDRVRITQGITEGVTGMVVGNEAVIGGLNTVPVLIDDTQPEWMPRYRVEALEKVEEGK